MVLCNNIMTSLLQTYVCVCGKTVRALCTVHFGGIISRVQPPDTAVHLPSRHVHDQHC
jgi:hypothetical protein